MEIRILSKNDSIEYLTGLIHRAYSQLSDLGFRYWATHQSVEDTKKRISKGECYLVLENDIIVGTVTLNFPYKTHSHPWYDKDDVTTFNQLAIEPNFQKQGIGSNLLDLIEQRAVEMGAKELSCDTASSALHLIDMYKKRGYREVGKVDWEITNYTSVILSKTLKA
jgi:GNAT superfamily N-acetyltransferase